MYYIILFLAVLSLLALAAWLDPARRLFPRAVERGAGQGVEAVPAGSNPVALWLRGERREELPCLTPIDCVREKRCAGHCGCR